MSNLVSDYAAVSDPAGEPIAVWERVSTDTTRQDIAAQTADLKAFIAAGCYLVVAVFRFEASAFKGRHAGKQAELLAGVQAGRYRTVVAAMSSRYERRGWQHAMYFGLMLHVEHGARVVAIDDASYGDMSTEMGGISTLLKAKSNFDYSDQISRNVNRKFRTMDDAGAFRGIAPAGYDVQGEEWSKRLVPAPVRREVTRHRKDKAASAEAGERVRAEVTVTRPSAQDIRQAFADAPKVSTVKLGARLGMTPAGVAQLLRNGVYSSGRYEVRRADGVAVIHRCEPLVTVAVQKAAMAALERRKTGDNTTSRALAKDDFSGALWCGACQQSTLHRYYSGGRKRLDGTPGPRARRYVCDDCRKSVRADDADAEANAVMGARSLIWSEPVWVEGDDTSAELARVGLELRELPGRGLDDDAEDSERARLRAEKRRLEAAPHESGHWEGSSTGITEGARWRGMTTAERRAWAVSGEFRLYVTAKPGRTGAVDVRFASTMEVLPARPYIPAMADQPGGTVKLTA